MRPRARLISLIGEELISDEPVALVELVKNSYDADANKVRIRFEGDDPDNPARIVVEDDGHGMTLDTVLSGWFEPGTISKIGKERSPRGRAYLGAKGIGRFASARIGTTLLLSTKHKGSGEAVVVLLEWGEFHDDSYLDDVSIEYESHLAPDMAPGTVLTIDGVRSGVWNEKAYTNLHSRLSRLISPFDDVTDFQIDLEIPAYPELSGPVEAPELVENPKYSFSGRVNKDGLITGNIKINGSKKKIEISTRKFPANAIPLCGPFEFEIRAWDRDREDLEPLALRVKQTVSQIRKTLGYYSGVSIYRDGFRVHPYGEPGNDWLRLDLRSRQNPTRNLANNQIIAAIRIGRRSNPELRDRSNREGMIENAEHDALREWFRAVLSLLEEARYKVRPRREIAFRSEPLFEAFDISDAVARVREDLGRDHPIAEIVAEAELQVAQGVTDVQEMFSRLLLSAGLGHMVDIVIHEIGAPIGKIGREIAVIEKRLVKQLEKSYQNEVKQRFDAIKGWLEQLHNLRGRLDPQTPAKRGRATTFDVRDEVGLSVELYKALIEKQGINVSVSKPNKPVRVRMSRAILGQVLANLIDNAIYWVAHQKGVGKGGNIAIELRPISHGFVIRTFDDGPGVKQEIRDTIFEPYFSTKPNGIGLGLYIARLVIEPYGRLLLLEEGKLSGAAFEARFEKGVGL